MSETPITAITMPKWGLSMVEGKVIEWLVEENTEISVGDEIMDIETEKIANTFEALDGGVLKRKVAEPDQTLPIGALLGVLAAADTPEADVDAYIDEFQANYVPPQVDDTEDSGPSYGWVEINAYKIRYLRMGEAPNNIVLIHGFGGDLDRWLFNQQPLAAQASVYAFDLPGHGQSTKALQDASVAALSDLVVAFMDRLEIADAHLIGHSLGGAIALQTAAAHSDKVSALTLIAPAGLGAEINGSYLHGFIAAQSRREIKPLLQQLVGDPSLINRSLIDDVLKFKRLDGVDAALAKIVAGFCEGDTQTIELRDALASLSIPRRVIWGSEDKIIPVTHADGLTQDVELNILPGFGHLVQLEAANEVNRLLSR